MTEWRISALRAIYYYGTLLAWPRTQSGARRQLELSDIGSSHIMDLTQALEEGDREAAEVTTGEFMAAMGSWKEAKDED